ncbi:putative small secreted protein [Microbacterium resistens]|uniref:Small secreted protein n=1 Tax=Microbacterium resistens TaxID=156977 RepID=A0ABU1SCC9_9MICO|nr:hypothetical protein [Microbacterium resistens]MDR6866573.1 putative small secreted protein [Microbacterium resistens]
MFRRPGVLIASLAVSALALAGCTGGSGAGSATTQPGTAQPGTAPPASDGPASPDPLDDEPTAAWLDDGRAVALVTWGSSSCPPRVGEVAGDAQTVTATIVEPDPNIVCTADFAPRATTIVLPAGVDPSKDVTLVTTGGVETKVRLPGNASLTGTPGQPTEYTASAGWFSATGIVLLTWGSSSCPPVVSGIEERSDGAAVSFSGESRICTMDMAPRATVLGLSAAPATTDGYTLTLQGDSLDGTVKVIGR